MGFDQEYWREIISGQADDWGARLVRPLLRGASWPYGAAVRGRRWAYGKGVLKSHAAGAPVICVGNITTGGTGKTPLVAWVVRYLIDQGRTPAILTRGYKAVGGVSDEAQMLEKATGAPVVVNPNRVAGAAAAVEAGADVLVMDDGFQHLRLRRDLNIVTIDATCPFGYGFLLPRGLLREPLTVLTRADVFVLTRCDQAPGLAALAHQLGSLSGGAPVVESVMTPTRVCSLDGRVEPVESLRGKKVWAFCGLGNPDSFYRTLRTVTDRVMGETTFNDHHAYDDLDLKHVARLARAAEAKFMITTAKDVVKATNFDATSAGVPLRYLEIEADFPDGGNLLKERINQAIAGGAE